MDQKELKGLVDELFKKRLSLTNLWQEIASHFYPERADFSLRRQMGTEFAEDLMTSYPLLARREFSDQIGAMLRPKAKEWFHMRAADESREDNEARRFLEWATGTQRRAMYDRVTQFTKATKQADNDYCTFGQVVMSIRMNSRFDALLFRTWHLRDCVWQENEDGEMALVARRWKPTARDLVRYFGKEKVSDKVNRMMEKKPFTEVDCLHAVVDADMWDGDAKGMPYFSIYMDTDHDHLIEAVATHNKEYIVPRWQTMSGSQYAFSPATVAALPDARLLQAMTYTILEAGEKVVNPPMIATMDVVRSDMSIYAGGTTWVDRDYDERLGQALRPLTTDAKGFPLSRDLILDTRTMLHQAFYLNKLSLPQRAAEMTAYEVGQRVQEYIRGALPIFEPTEDEYNGAMCELVFDLLMRNGGFGSPLNMPKRLQGADIKFSFESPLHDAIEAQKGHKFIEAKAMIAEAAAVDEGAVAMIDAQAALRDALHGIGVPAKWVRSEPAMEEIQAAREAAEQSQQVLAAMEQSSMVAKNLGVQAGGQAGGGGVE